MDSTPWPGWRFGGWGKSKRTWLYSPCGRRFTPEEVLSLHELALDVDYWRAQCRRLESLALDDLERDTLRAAVDILERRARVRRQNYGA